MGRLHLEQRGFTVQIKSCPDSKRPLKLQIQQLSACSHGCVLWRQPHCGCWCLRLGVHTGGHHIGVLCSKERLQMNL